LFEIIRKNFSKFYNPSKYLAVVVHPKKNANVSASKCSNYTTLLDIHDMNVYLGKDRQRAAQHLRATHTTVTNLTRGVEGFGHKL